MDMYSCHKTITFTAVASVTYPLVINAVEMPRFLGIVAGDGDFVITAMYPTHRRRQDISASGC